MMTEETFNKLEALVGQTKTYQKKPITINQIKDVNGIAVVKTDRRTFSLMPDEVDDFIKSLEAKAKRTVNYDIAPKPTAKRKFKNKGDVTKDRMSSNGLTFMPSDSNILKALKKIGGLKSSKEISAELEKEYGKRILPVTVANALYRLKKKNKAIMHKDGYNVLWTTDFVDVQINPQQEDEVLVKNDKEKPFRKVSFEEFIESVHPNQIKNSKPVENYTYSNDDFVRALLHEKNSHQNVVAQSKEIIEHIDLLLKFYNHK